MTHNDPTVTLQFSLSDDPRTRLPDWYKDVCKASSTLLAHLDVAGGLFMVGNDDTWHAHPSVLTNAAAVLASGDPPDYRARPDFPRPAAHANNAAGAAVSLFKQELDAHVSYTIAKAALTAALLASIGTDNKTYLEATMHPVPVYSLSPRQIVEAMFLQHGQTTGPDLQKLRDPLLKLLPAMAELETHMNLFMLASVKLTASGHGENPYRYFEMFLESVKGFPVIRQQLPGFFTAYPTVNRQTITVLFPFLRPLITHMMAESSASPFSGAATAPPKTTPNRRQKQRKTGKERKQQWGQWTAYGQPAFPSHCAGAFQQAQTPPLFLGQDREAAYVAELQRCYAAMATTAPAEHVFAATQHTWNQNGFSAGGTSVSPRPRKFYCGLHGWNNSHDSPQCNVMAKDPSYPAVLRSATTHEGTGLGATPK